MALKVHDSHFELDSLYCQRELWSANIAIQDAVLLSYKMKLAELQKPYSISKKQAEKTATISKKCEISSVSSNNVRRRHAAEYLKSLFHSIIEHRADKNKAAKVKDRQLKQNEKSILTVHINAKSTLAFECSCLCCSEHHVIPKKLSSSHMQFRAYKAKQILGWETVLLKTTTVDRHCDLQLRRQSHLLEQRRAREVVDVLLDAVWRALLGAPYEPPFELQLLNAWLHICAWPPGVGRLHCRPPVRPLSPPPPAWKSAQTLKGSA
eukprot:6206073-Pleurochrysis_carterae.AAC.1